METHSTVLAKSDEGRLAKKCAAVGNWTQSATFLQKNEND